MIGGTSNHHLCVFTGVSIHPAKQMPTIKRNNIIYQNAIEIFQNDRKKSHVLICFNSWHAPAKYQAGSAIKI